MAQQLERTDPPRRTSAAQAGDFRHLHPDRKYVLANPVDYLHGLQVHLDNDWQKVNGKSDKERVVGGKVEDNGDVTYQGLILIWLKAAEWEAREEGKKHLRQSREAKKHAPGGLDGIVKLDGKPAQNM